MSECTTIHGRKFELEVLVNEIERLRNVYVSERPRLSATPVERSASRMCDEIRVVSTRKYITAIYNAYMDMQPKRVCVQYCWIRA